MEIYSKPVYLIYAGTVYGGTVAAATPGRCRVVRWPLTRAQLLWGGIIRSNYVGLIMPGRCRLSLCAHRRIDAVMGIYIDTRT